MICSACAAEVPEDDLFCEICGASLQDHAADASAPEAAAIESCAAGHDDPDEDGFCLRCGRRIQRPASDHIEEVISANFAAVSDRGLRHDRNEDRFALVNTDAGCALVVCDGVSTTAHSEVASAIVAAAVARELRAKLASPEAFDAGEALIEAIAEAAAELKTQAGGAHADQSPSTTVVAALVEGREITVGWSGDSRAYWIDAEGVTLLTHDHSWLHAVLAEESMTEAEARRSPQAHAITRWVGADADPEAGPDIVHREASVEGTLLLCTDGLWNELADAVMLGQLMLEAATDPPTALAIAQHLVAFANGRGARDNTTVALLQFGPAAVVAGLVTDREPTDA